MKFFVAFNGRLLARYRDLIGELVPFMPDSRCHRGLKDANPAAELSTHEISEVDEPANAASRGG